MRPVSIYSPVTWLSDWNNPLKISGRPGSVAEAVSLDFSRIRYQMYIPIEEEEDEEEDEKEEEEIVIRINHCFKRC